MLYVGVCILIFLASYALNMLYTSVFFHRGLTHRAVKLSKFTEKLVVHTGNWVTGIDPKTWVCMHRLHHKFADTRKDPHTPRYGSIFSVFKKQLDSYGKTRVGLLRKREFFTSQVKDLKFSVHWLNRSGFWYLPHLLHTVIALLLAYYGFAGIGLAFWLGIMSHPIQGWAVNSFGHKYGYRNFSTRDHSTNNTAVALLVMGEGYQNNHHHRPHRANFAMKNSEIDFGYGLCLIARALGMISF